MKPGTTRPGAMLFWTAMAAMVAVSAPDAQPGAPGKHWVATWGTAQQSYRAPAATAGPTAAPASAPAAAAAAPTPPTSGARVPARRYGIPPPLAGVENQTIRMIVRSSLGGEQVRVRLSQAYGAPSVTLGAAHVAIRASGAGVVPASDRALTFSGQPTATVYAGQTLISDPVRLSVPPLTDLAVSLYFPGETGPPTSHTFGLRPAYLAPGNVADRADFAASGPPLESYYWLTGMDVLAPASSGTLVAFGDSITDGDQSTPDTSGAWPSVLATRLQGSKATAGVAVVNAGISGNRLLGDNGSGLARVMRDALSVPGVRWMTLLEGINDITAATRSGQAGTAFTAGTLIAGYRQIIETAHLHGVKVIGCTLTPYGESNVFTAEGERIRQAANAWIRSSRAFDAVFDFDAATRDPANPARFRREADSPDMLHPANPGYALMAGAIDLSVLTRPGRVP